MNQRQSNRRSRSGAGQSTIVSGVGILLLVLIALFGSGQIGGNTTDPVLDHRTDFGMPIVSADILPREAQATIRLLERGGPFPYRQDGAVFGNRERLLPLRPDGYYREYTVPTPGENDRGARRIVGGEAGQLYYTDDHYDSFVKVE